MSSSLLRLLSAAYLPVLLLLPLPTQAQPESDTTARDRPPAFQKGGWGLQYEATSLDGALSGFQGSLLSARYHLSSRQALRVGVTLNVTTEDSESSVPDQDPNWTSERDSQNYGLSGQYVHYIQPTDRLFMFAGIGPRFAYDRSRRQETNPNQPRRQDVGESTSYIIGLTGAFGVEWFVHPHISLSAEYPLAVDYLSSDEEATSRVGDEETTRTTESDRYEIGGEPVRIGVTFSFGP